MEFVNKDKDGKIGHINWVSYRDELLLKIQINYKNRECLTNFHHHNICLISSSFAYLGPGVGVVLLLQQ